MAKAPANTKEEGHSSYGFGSRLRVGRHVANDALLINIASILWAFDLQSMGGRISSATDFVNSGIVMRPAPFECSFKPRFPEIPTVLSAVMELHDLRIGDM
ncbi:uncharacterized protein B0H18DRAFT_1031887 [Fomitopsis serialis]|uniref:uncharacterized protein n=1 Tax=Fomitopsis serialis TaxID=139415 RepID=UPI0020084E80|nr:uncharacterized protein B0H18DRAFT_1031887 [Neoantrodia serialis]KAH9918277.1 hypothetical protein B0H18DRAFT_1031887 [Neoantrodia serialis]